MPQTLEWGLLNARIWGGYRDGGLPCKSQGAQLDKDVLLASFLSALPCLLSLITSSMVMWRTPRPDFLLTKEANLFFYFFFSQKTSYLYFSHMHLGI